MVLKYFPISVSPSRYLKNLNMSKIPDFAVRETRYVVFKTWLKHCNSKILTILVFYYRPMHIPTCLGLQLILFL